MANIGHGSIFLAEVFFFNMHQINARAKKNETLVEKERHNKKTSERKERERQEKEKPKIHQTEKKKQILELLLWLFFSRFLCISQNGFSFNLFQEKIHSECRCLRLNFHTIENLNHFVWLYSLVLGSMDVRLMVQ